MTEAVEQPAIPRKPKQKRINYALGAVLVSKGFEYEEAAKQCGAKNGRVLRVGLRRKGITATASRALLPSIPERVSVTAKIVSDVTEAMRERTNGVLSNQIRKLETKSVGRLANRGQGEAAVLETLSRTWRNLNGSPDSVTFGFGVNVISGPATLDVTPQPVVDCVSSPVEVQPIEPLPVQVLDSV